MGKTKAVKWSIGAEEPEDLQEFLSNDEIVDKHVNKKTQDVEWPGKGPFTFAVKQLRVKPNKNGDDRISVILSLKEPKGSDAASWNGYTIFDGFNVVEGPSLSFLKRFLRSLGLEWEDFVKRSKQDDQDPPHLVQIGKVKFETGTDVTLKATVKVLPADDFNDDEHMEIGRYLPIADEEPEVEDVEDEEDEEEDEDDIEVVDEDEDEDDSDEDEDDDDDDEEDEDDEEEEDDDEDEEDDEDDLEAEREELREELSGLKVAALSKRATRLARKAKIDTDDVPAKKKDLIEFIVEQEIAPF